MKPLKAMTVNVTTERGKEGLFYGTSLELRGLLIAEETPELVSEKAPETIAAMYHATGVENVDIITVGHNRFVARPITR